MNKNQKARIVVLKATATLVAGIAVAAVATAAIKNIVPMDGLTKLNKVMYGIGIVVISSTVAEAGSNHVGQLLDSIVNTSEAISDQINQSA
jgi:hypothetical protein